MYLHKVISTMCCVLGGLEEWELNKCSSYWGS